MSSRSKIDGSKYFYWRNRYISTGNLRAFDLMTKHYAAMDPKPVHDIPAPVGKRHKPLQTADDMMGLIYAGKIMSIDTYIDPDYEEKYGKTPFVFVSNTLGDALNA